jgi:hypothetical protein
MPSRLVPAALTAVLLVTGSLAAQQALTDEARRVRDATTVFDEIMAAEDRRIPESILGESEGIARSAADSSLAACGAGAS